MIQPMDKVEQVQVVCGVCARKHKWRLYKGCNMQVVLMVL